MSFNGSGTFSIINTFVYDTVISETDVNANFTDVATGLSTCITKDGQTTVTANIPMATFKFTGLGDGSAAQDATALHQIQDQDGIWCGTAGGTANAITLTPSPAITAYGTGQKFEFKAGASPSSTAITIAVSGLATKAGEIDDAALSASVTIEANKYYSARYDGTAFQLTRLSTDSQGYLTSSAIGSTVQAYDADTLFADTTDQLTVGFTGTAYDLGNSGSGSVAVSIANGQMQYLDVTGSFTLAALSDTGVGTVIIRALNDGTGGYSPDFSAYTTLAGGYVATASVTNIIQLIKTDTGQFIQFAQP